VYATGEKGEINGGHKEDVMGMSKLMGECNN
jgi:hypothetical protein